MSYRSKSTDSFNTRKKPFIFNCVIHDKKEFSDQEFLDFKITKELIQCYTAEFFQFLPGDILYSIDCKKKVSEIFSEINSFEKNISNDKWKNLEELYFNQIFTKQFPQEDFKALTNANKCSYCGITMAEVNALVEEGKIYKKNERGWTFEIDRKKPNHEYTTENCVAVCYWCNNAKTDGFDDMEFNPIGDLIGKTLKAHLNK